MLATHRVKDGSSNTVGFIVDGVFYTDYTIKNNIEYIDNLTLLKSGIIRAKKELPEVNYKNTVIKGLYDKVLKDNPFVRDIQKDFEYWYKNLRDHLILEVQGCRQIGKTTEIKKFAYKHYDQVIYTNLMSDIDFAKSIEHGVTPLNIEKYCRTKGLISFKNNNSTVIIIDEIQFNEHVFNSVRDFKNNLKCDVIITGSYLGRALGTIPMNREKLFTAAGDTHILKMNTLSFKEFCRIFKCEQLLNKIDLYGKSNTEQYEKLNKLYNIYRQIGGYPAVVRTYVKTQSIDSCYMEIHNILDKFKEESKIYFKNPREIQVFSVVYDSALIQMCKENRGTGKNTLDEITEIANSKLKNHILLASSQEVTNAVSWIHSCGILTTCDLAIDGDLRNLVFKRRLFFNDCGLVSYLSRKTMISKSTIEGILSETFVLNELNRLVENKFGIGKGQQPRPTAEALEDGACKSSC